MADVGAGERVSRGARGVPLASVKLPAVFDGPGDGERCTNVGDTDNLAPRSRNGISSGSADIVQDELIHFHLSSGIALLVSEIVWYTQHMSVM